MQKNKIYLIGLIICGLTLLSGANIYAQNTDATSDSNEQTEDSAINEVDQAIQENTELTDETETLEGATIKSPDSIPSNFGLFWRNIQERISIALTLNPVKKAEKRLVFAEERIKLAEYIISKTDDPKIQEKAQKMLEKADEYMQRIEEKKDELSKIKDNASEVLLQNIARHNLNKELILNKIENKLPAEKLENFQKFRQKIEIRTNNFLENLDNKMSDKAKNKIGEMKERLQIKQGEQEQIRKEGRGLLEQIKSGDETAKEKFNQLRQEQLEKIKQERESFKDASKTIIERIKEDKEGLKSAVSDLKSLNQEKRDIMKGAIQIERMTLGEAIKIAQSSGCIKEGKLTDKTTYNQNTKTWWIDLNIEKPGCKPACVVKNDKTTEINWRCTGLIMPSTR